MELVNATRMQAGFSLGMEPSGRELLVVVIKGTFTLPRGGERIGLYHEQLPLLMADTCTGEPGFSAPVYEADFAARKRHCDVLLIGSAHAPDGRPAARVPVGIRIGRWEKRFVVVGDRRWSAGVGGIRAGAVEPFVRKAISYDIAFGGIDDAHPDPGRHAAFAANPVGRGFHRQLKSEWVDGAPMPNTEEIDRPIVRPDDDTIRPMSLGPIGRGWQPRIAHAGTYDQAWIDEHFPFLPPDFDDRYYQAAPPDQQLALSPGEQPVLLGNLTSDGRRAFTLPDFEAPVVIFPKNGKREDHKGVLDTIVFEPDEDRFTMCWRVTRPLRQSIREIAQVVVGRKGTAWWQQRLETPFPIPVVVPQSSPDGATA